MENLEKRFFSKVNKTKTCWLWTATKYKNGYGSFSYNGKKHGAHRVSYEPKNGPIPYGLHVLHRCDIRACVNPTHLFVGTAKDNIRDASTKGRLRNQNFKKTKCKYGHPFNKKNLVIINGKRQCRICINRRSREYRIRLQGGL